MPAGEREIMESILQPTDRLLELVGLAGPEECGLGAFAGVRGSREQGLVVVGRVPEGVEGPTFTAESVRGGYGRNQVLSALRDGDGSRGDLSSPFWRVAKAVAESRGDADVGNGEWAEAIGWTHLYRVVPVEGPLTEGLRTLQLPLCAQLFWREILIWRPRRVLFMTGLEWAAPFVFAHHSSELRLQDGGGAVKATGTLRLQGAKTPALVVMDPPSGAVDPESVASEVTGALAALGA